jgi:tetratricopeptide (TPR) repeat protein
MQPARLYLAAALAVRAGDTAAANRLARELERMPGFEGSSIPHDLALAVRARQLAKEGNPSGALALLEKQQLRIPARYALFYSRIAQPWLRATLLDSLGRKREALPMYDAVAFYGSINPIFIPMAHLRKARILAAEGDKGGAIEHYSRFIELWKNCEPVERPELDRARAELAQLESVTLHSASQ